MAKPEIVIEPFDGDQLVADTVATHHLAVRLQQRKDGENDFITTDIYDSQADLKGMQSYYVEPGGNFFIARDISADEIAGFIGLKRVGKTEGEIKRMAVMPHYRRQKIGTRLAEQAVAWATGQGLAKLHLYTGEGEQSIHIYESVGFSLISRRPERGDQLMTLDLS